MVDDNLGNLEETSSCSANFNNSRFLAAPEFAKAHQHVVRKRLFILS